MDSSISLVDFKALCGKTKDNSNCLLKLTLVLIRMATKVNNAWTTALASQVVELGGVPITKEEVKQQVLADDDEEEEEGEEEAGPSNKKPKKGGQQKITFPKAAKASVAHPAGTGIMGLLLGMLFMGLKSVGGKRM